jgi:hypothetical protein
VHWNVCQVVPLFWFCIIFHATEFFERSIECLYSFFSIFQEEYDDDVNSVLKYFVRKYWYNLLCMRAISHLACQRGSLGTYSKHSRVYTHYSHNFERNSVVTSIYRFEK